MCGLHNVKIQTKLLNTEDLSFDRACQIATAMEMAEKNSQEFHPSSSSAAGTSNKETVKNLKAGKESNIKEK